MTAAEIISAIGAVALAVLLIFLASLLLRDETDTLD